jgi:hypothetical protein
MAIIKTTGMVAKNEHQHSGMGCLIPRPQQACEK